MSDDHQVEWVRAAEAKRNPGPVEKSNSEKFKEIDDKDPWCLARKALPDGRVVRLYQIIDGVSINLAKDGEVLVFDRTWHYFGKDIRQGLVEYIKYNGDYEPEGWTRKNGTS